MRAVRQRHERQRRPDLGDRTLAEVIRVCPFNDGPDGVVEADNHDRPYRWRLLRIGGPRWGALERRSCRGRVPPRIGSNGRRVYSEYVWGLRATVMLDAAGRRLLAFQRAMGRVGIFRISEEVRPVFIVTRILDGAHPVSSREVPALWAVEHYVASNTTSARAAGLHARAGEQGDRLVFRVPG